MTAPRSLPLFALAGLLALFLFQLGARDLVSSHEARAAQNAQRMLDTGEWGLPTLFDGQIDLQKPPGYYWLVAAAGALNGGAVTPFAARLPAALAAVATVLLVFGFLRREGSGVGAWVGAAALATATHLVAIGRTARIDVPLTCAVAVSLLAFVRGVASRKKAVLTGSTGSEEINRTEADQVHLVYSVDPVKTAFLLSALAAGCAVLLKGPVGLALIGPTAVVWLVAERRASAERPRLPVGWAAAGVAVVAAVAVPWFVWANVETNGAFVRVFFWHHNVARFAGGADSLAAHPWWYYGPRFALAFLPWTLALVPLVWWGLRNGLWNQSRAFRLGVIWCAVMVAVLSASRFKRADYLLPAFTGAALALGAAAEHWARSRTEAKSLRRATWAFGLLLAGALATTGVMWFAVEPAEAARQDKKTFADAIRAAAPAPQRVLLFRTEAHLLSFHLGTPLHTLVEWGELRDMLATGSHVVVMPPEYAAEAGRVTGRRLEPVVSLAECVPHPPRPLVCLRTAD